MLKKSKGNSSNSSNSSSAKTHGQTVLQALTEEDSGGFETQSTGSTSSKSHLYSTTV